MLRERRPAAARPAGIGFMPWFSDPQRDSRDDIHAAQQALVFAGCPHSLAVAAYETYSRWNLAGPGHAPDLAPRSAGLGSDLAGLGVGLILGVGLTWIHAPYLEVP